MSDFITNGSEYNGKESVDILVRPLKEQMLPMGIRVVDTERSGSVKLTFFGKLKKLLMPYSDGWQGGSGATKKQKKFSLAEFKAEAAYSKQDYADTILEQVVNVGGVAQNEITGTDVHNAEIEVFNNAINHDIWRNFWLGDTTKRHTSAGTYPDGSTAYAIGDPDKYYNQINGLWTSLINSAAAYASATEDQVRRITMDNGAVAEVDTVTLTGTGGTANINIKGKNYLATFASNLTTTAANFVTAYEDELLQRNIVVTSSGADVILTSSIAGVALGTTTITNVTTNLAGSVANTTPNTAAAALATDEALSTFKSMYRNSTQELRGIEKSQLRYYVTESMYFNYEDTLTSGGTEQARTQLVDGVERYIYNGIPVIPVQIDQEIENDFEGAYPHRAILSTPQNLALVLSTGNNLAETRFWFNPDANQNRQRTQFEMGADFVLPELVTVAY